MTNADDAWNAREYQDRIKELEAQISALKLQAAAMQAHIDLLILVRGALKRIAEAKQKGDAMNS